MDVVSKMSEIERLYYSYLNLSQYSELAKTVDLSLLVMIVVALLCYVTLPDVSKESKLAELCYKVAEKSTAIFIGLFVLSTLVLLYFSAASTLTRVEIEKQCIKEPSLVCDRLSR